MTYPNSVTRSLDLYVGRLQKTPAFTYDLASLFSQFLYNSFCRGHVQASLETFLSILNSNLEETEIWLKQVIKKLPKDYSTVLIFDVLTGLRPSKAAMSCKLITELSEKGKLGSYLDKDLLMLQHFRFPDLFLRQSKNAYISFRTPELLQLVLETRPSMKYSAIDTMIGR